MGFSSFLTSDTKESIFNKYTLNNKTVYLLMPNNEQNIKLFNYNGYHTFESDYGDINIFKKLFEMNFGENVVTENNKFDLGVACYIGKFYKTKNGNIYANSIVAEVLRFLNVDNVFIYENYYKDIFIDGEVTNIIKHNKSGNFEKCYVDSLLTSHLKFSFNEAAKYESFDKAEQCPNQGFF
ncbi:hypothetical protein UA32_12065 [Photobacterium angustum]|uniref:Uncharacterized protein n=1 Tax=Photobacterium angustum TaxID=661 RepID=A0ABX5GYI8_PHOAN|nr:hypothetical protein [Photobacterium angustum]KJG37692.1 hypothetical protein UA32_12065 [Photobacterium angustum]PSX03976.1 hypothetical protein C0W27_21010 [Photobacterium angustum]